MNAHQTLIFYTTSKLVQCQGCVIAVLLTYRTDTPPTTPRPYRLPRGREEELQVGTTPHHKPGPRHPLRTLQVARNTQQQKNLPPPGTSGVLCAPPIPCFSRRRCGSIFEIYFQSRRSTNFRQQTVTQLACHRTLLLSALEGARQPWVVAGRVRSRQSPCRVHSLQLLSS